MTDPAAPPPAPVLRDDEVRLPGGPRLALRRAAGPRRPFLLVHGLASNARLWDGVGRRLARAGHEVVAVDLRGHGRSEETRDGYSTGTAADDLAALCAALDLTGARAPIAAGQSWGGNVVLDLAARHGGVAALALVDGGWLRLRERFPDFTECWRVLAPPRFDGVRMADLPERWAAAFAGWPEESVVGALANLVEQPDGTVRARLAREHHREILHSLWAGDPRPLYSRVDVPVLLLAAVPAAPQPAGGTDEADVDGGGEAAAKQAAVREAARLLPRARVAWYVGAHHDLHAEQPDRAVADLLALAAEVSGERSPPPSSPPSPPPSPPPSQTGGKAP